MWKPCPQRGQNSRQPLFWSWPPCPALVPSPQSAAACGRVRWGRAKTPAVLLLTVPPAGKLPGNKLPGNKTPGNKPAANKAGEQAPGNGARCTRSFTPACCSHLPNFCHPTCYLDADCRLRSRVCGVKGLTKRPPPDLNARFQRYGGLLSASCPSLTTGIKQ
jgi:hypothetical protein